MHELGWKWTVIEPGDDLGLDGGASSENDAEGLPPGMVADLLADAPDGSERERRRLILEDIATRIRENGPRQARPDPDRASQFMPFAALKGYAELIAAQERAHGEDGSARC